MSGLDVCLFGRLSVRCGDQVVSGLRSRKVQELFAYLVLHRNRPHHREILADVLWDDSASAQSRKCLRQALWRLQAVLGSHTDPLTARVLLVEHDWIQLNSDAGVWSNVAELQHTPDLVQGAAGHRLDARLARIVHSAVHLYQGHLLERWY
jgi:DNA-binding SARP family transcriptional activator